MRLTDCEANPGANPTIAAFTTTTQAL
jgi:hypothetical protein